MMDIRNKKGSALVLVLIMLVVFSILGTAILFISVSETRFTAHEANRMRAYYIARSGAEAAAKWLSDPANATAVNNISNNEASPTLSSANTALGDGFFSLKLFRKDPVGAETPKLVIQSTGTSPSTGSGSVSQTETLTLNKEILFKKAIYAAGNLNNDNNSMINGDVEAVGTIAHPDKVNGDKITGSTHIYPPPVFPNTPEFEAKFGADEVQYPGTYPSTPHMSNHPTLYTQWKINSNTIITDASCTNYRNFIYHDITIQSNNNLTFDITSDFRILVDNFSALNNINITVLPHTPQAKLIIYVNNTLDFKCEIISPPETVYIFAKDGAQINMQTGLNVFNGYIYGPGANVNYKSGTYSGAIIGHNVDLGSGGVVNYVGTGMNYILPEDFGISSFGYSKGLWSH